MLIGNKEFDLKNNTYVMGILNVTPDSFSDGGKFNNVYSAIEAAKKMVEDGADIIDIGGESTRPGAEYVSVEEELNRVVPVIRALSKEINISISIDTYKSKVAEEAVKAGASLINDVWGFKKDPDMAKVAAKYDVAVCLMHNRNNKEYNSLLDDMMDDLKESINIAKKAGVKDEKIILDPGVGFAKTLEDNLDVMNNLEKFNELGYPVLLGTSRKSMIGLTLNLPVNERVEGTIATSVIGVMKNMSIIRVHDVKENKRAIDMTKAILGRNING